MAPLGASEDVWALVLYVDVSSSSILIEVTPGEPAHGRRPESSPVHSACIGL